MDGETALWYARARYTTSDYNRARRSQEVLMGLFHGMLSINAVANASSLYEHYRSGVETDMAVYDIMPLVPLAAELNQPSRIRYYNLGANEAMPFTIPETGAQVLLPNVEAIQAIFWQGLNPLTCRVGSPLNPLKLGPLLNTPKPLQPQNLENWREITVDFFLTNHIHYLYIAIRKKGEVEGHINEYSQNCGTYHTPDPAPSGNSSLGNLSQGSGSFALHDQGVHG